MALSDSEIRPRSKADRSASAGVLPKPNSVPPLSERIRNDCRICTVVRNSQTDLLALRQQAHQQPDGGVERCGGRLLVVIEAMAQGVANIMAKLFIDPVRGFHTSQQLREFGKWRPVLHFSHPWFA